jgi:predicted dehydrogenase
MSNTIRVGVLGLTHDHVWTNLRHLKQSATGELVAVADPNPELRARAQKEFACQQLYADASTMLENEKLDAVYVFSDNATGTDLVVLAAQHGLHVMVEKPMAATLDGAVRMLAAARMANVKLMVNWPFAWYPELQHAINMAQSGAIGTIHGLRYRVAHRGPKDIGCSPYFYNWLYDAELNGAGAYMDFCCYGAALARHLLGMPSRVNATIGHLLKDYATVDDNGVLVMQWARAMAIAEGSWTQVGALASNTTVIYGSEGTLLVEKGKEERVLMATRDDPHGVVMDIPAAAEDRRSGSAYFLSCIQNDTPVEGLCSAEVGRDTQEIVEAGLLAAAKFESVGLPLAIY